MSCKPVRYHIHQTVPPKHKPCQTSFDGQVYMRPSRSSSWSFFFSVQGLNNYHESVLRTRTGYGSKCQKKVHPRLTGSKQSNPESDRFIWYLWVFDFDPVPCTAVGIGPTCPPGSITSSSISGTAMSMRTCLGQAVPVKYQQYPPPPSAIAKRCWQSLRQRALT